MNTHAEYRRHSYQQPEQPTTSQPAEAAVNELARHRDPSLQQTAATPSGSRTGVAWVRPTDLASYLGPMVGRGIDLQAELIRRARRTPVTTGRAVQRSLHRSPAPERPAPQQEGLQL